MEVITSSSNKIAKHIKSLYIRKNREAYREFTVEGLRIVNEALNSGWEISVLVVSESFYGSNGIDYNVKTLVVCDKLFEEISDTDNPQGIMAVIKMPYADEEPDFKAGAKLVVLDCLQDPGNMGTIIRTADAFGVDGIVVSEGCVDIYNSKTLRATMGSIFHIPIYKSDNIERFIIELKNDGYKVYASHLSGEDIRGIDAGGKTAVIIGNEANGIKDSVSSLADKLVKIPMPGRAESLNASVAAGVLMYELFLR